MTNKQKKTLNRKRIQKKSRRQLIKKGLYRKHT